MQQTLNTRAYSFVIVFIKLLTNRDTASYDGIAREEGFSRKRAHRSSRPHVGAQELVHRVRLSQVPENCNLKSLNRGVGHQVVNDPLMTIICCC